MAHAKSSKSGTQTKDAPHLSASDIRRLAKPRTGFVQFAQSVIAVIKSRPDTFVAKVFDPDATLTSLGRYATMAEDVSEKKSAYVTAADEQLVLGSDIWQQVLVAYQLLKTAARTDGRIQTAIEPLEAFMRKRGASKKHQTMTTATTQSTASTPTTTAD